MNDHHDDDELLDRLGDAIATPVPPPDPARVQAVRDQAAASATTPPPTVLRSRRSMLRLGALAAGSAAAGVAVGLGVSSLVEDEPPKVPLQPVDSVEVADGVTASASLIDHTWGLEVVLDVDGLDTGAPYQMVFTTNDGRQIDAGGFIGTGTLMKCRNNGAVLKSEVSRWTVRSPDGAAVVAADVT